MAQKDAFLNIPPNLDGIEELSEAVLSGGDATEQKALSDIKKNIKRLRIRNEYFRRLKNDNEKGEEIRRELAERYHKDLSTIDTIIYKWK